MTQPHQLGYGFAGSSRYGSYYQHSGQISASGVIGAILIGAVTAFAMGWAYMFAAVYIPIPKLDALLCLVFGIAMGAIPATILRKMKVRNIPISVAVVFVVAAIGFYTSWVSWEWWLLRRYPDINFVNLFVRPMAVLRIAERINTVGTWRMSAQDTENTKGVFLSIIWAIEALTILVTAPLVARSMIGEKPFCEKCDQWCEGPVVIRRTVPVEACVLHDKLEAGEFNFVSGLPTATSGQFTEFQRYSCNKCGQLNTLRAVSHNVKRDKKGRVRGDNKKTLINKLLISSDDLKKIAAAPPGSPTTVVTKPA